MNVGERIQKRRKELGLSVDELAERLGKNRATVYRYESNEIEKLPTTILEPLSKALNVSPAYLMGWEDTPSIKNELSEDEKNVIKEYKECASPKLMLEVIKIMKNKNSKELEAIITLLKEK